MVSSAKKQVTDLVHVAFKCTPVLDSLISLDESPAATAKQKLWAKRTAHQRFPAL
jgi:hypothetical protein